jgi:hypothetical protein
MEINMISSGVQSSTFEYEQLQFFSRTFKVLFQSNPRPFSDILRCFKDYELYIRASTELNCLEINLTTTFFLKENLKSLKDIHCHFYKTARIQAYLRHWKNNYQN